MDPSISNPQSLIPNTQPTPQTPNPKPQITNPTTHTLSPKPKRSSLKSNTLALQHQTPNRDQEMSETQGATAEDPHLNSNRLFQVPCVVPHAAGFWRAPGIIKGLKEAPEPESSSPIALSCTTRHNSSKRQNESKISASASTHQGFRRAPVQILKKPI